MASLATITILSTLRDFSAARLHTPATFATIARRGDINFSRNISNNTIFNLFFVLKKIRYLRWRDTIIKSKNPTPEG